MRTMPEWLVTLCRVTLIVSLPVALVLTNVRLLMTHAFPEIIYSLPGFPDDPYGFTKSDRLQWSKRSVDYILGDDRAGAIESWKFPGGQQAPAPSCQYYLPPRDCTFFYNDREVRHMVDVRNLTGVVLVVWAAMALAAVLSAGALARAGEAAALRSGLLTGAAVTVGLLVVTVVVVLVSFQAFFTQFHRVFFEGDTWIFLWSDSLIRLFPLAFWQTAFLIIGLGAIIEAGLVALLAWRGFR